ncbi:MAG TPA: hypothetical protein VII06_19110 [Chloroflexota bacterium]|jgi:hypothetical protein
MGKYLTIADRVLGELGVHYQAAPTAPEEEPLWWEGPPWNGNISDGEFHAVIAAYIARYGVYTPDLPRREPELLERWIATRAGRWPPR